MSPTSLRAARVRVAHRPVMTTDPRRRRPSPRAHPRIPRRAWTRARGERDRRLHVVERRAERAATRVAGCSAVAVTGDTRTGSRARRGVVSPRRVHGKGCQRGELECAVLQADDPGERTTSFIHVTQDLRQGPTSAWSAAHSRRPRPSWSDASGRCTRVCRCALSSQRPWVADVRFDICTTVQLC